MPHTFEFSYHNPTQIHFGPNSFAKLGELIPRDAKVMLLYGGGSIKQNGIYDQVTQALAEDWTCVEELGGGEGKKVADLCAEEDDAEEGAILGAVGEVREMREANTDEEKCEGGETDALKVAARFIGKD